MLAQLAYGSDHLPLPIFPPRQSVGLEVLGGLRLTPPGWGIHRPGMRPLVSLPIRPSVSQVAFLDFAICWW